MTAPECNTPARDAALAVIAHLRAQGHEAYLAGGCVRDELLGLTPGDYDVATDATPQRLASLFHHARLVGAKFGVVQVRREGIWTEVATFRSDGDYSDRRRPDAVTFSDPQSDAERRDFTINALFLDPMASPSEWTTHSKGRARGRVIDLVSGLADLESGIIRAVGDPERRLAEDHLRALRAVRFAARLGFEIEPQTAHAIAAHSGQLEGISRERIGGELRRMLVHASRARAASLLESLGLDAPVFEERPVGAGLAHPRLSNLPQEHGVAPALAAWMLDRGHGFELAGVKPMAARLRQALCLSNDEHTLLVQVLQCRHAILDGFLETAKAAQKRQAASPGFENALRILFGEAPDLAIRVSQRMVELQAEPGGLAPARWVTGDDLIARGLIPGPQFVRILEGLYDLQLDGTAQDRATLLEQLAILCVQEGKQAHSLGTDHSKDRTGHPAGDKDHEPGTPGSY